jgi:4-azaleucine resistance transporter AzlC
MRVLLVAAAPFAVAVFGFGISFGVLATAAGMPGWQAVLMSALVFAGSSQFATLSVVAGGGSPFAAVWSGALLNARFVATGAAAAPSLPGGRLVRVLLAQLIVDEPFALGVAAGEEDRPDGRTMLVSGVLVWSAWVGGTTIGTLAGSAVGDPARLGLDAAFPVMFLALAWGLVKEAPDGRRAAWGGALVALALAPFTPPGVPQLGAVVVGLALSK